MHRRSQVTRDIIRTLALSLLLGGTSFLPMPLLAQSVIVPTIDSQRSVALRRERMRRIMDVVTKDVENNFYDANLKGVNWQELKAQARQRLNDTSSESEMVAVIFGLVDSLQNPDTIFAPPPVAQAVSRHTPNLAMIVNQLHRHPYEMEQSKLAIIQSIQTLDTANLPKRSVTPQFGFEAKAYGPQVRIHELTPGGSAEASGLKLGDTLLSINGFEAERQTLPLMLLFFRSLSPVDAMQISFSRGGPPQSLHIPARIDWDSYVMDMEKVENFYQFRRESKEKRPVLASKVGDDGIAHLSLPELVADRRKLNEIVNDVRDARAFIVDLRGNFTGPMDSAAHFAGFFETEKTVLGNIVDRKGKKALAADARNPKLTGPMVILVDSETGGAAEVFARHFQRTRESVIIGDRTAGRATQTRIFEYEFGTGQVIPYAVQVATARFVFSDGEEIEGRGVEPDQGCFPSSDDLLARLDPCLELARLVARDALTRLADRPD
jgi:C-terminal processing protease CtpA/Prc